MELSQKLSKINNIVLPIEDFLYLLQLEDYYNEFYFKRMWRFFFRRNIANRGKLENTGRIKILRVLYFILFVAKIVFVYYFWQSLSLVFLLLVFFSLLTPIVIGIINLITTPLNILIKNRVEAKVQSQYLQKGSAVKSICIVGSYGKTTTRNYLKDVLQYNYRVMTPSGNINTGAGLALWFQKKFSQAFDILIFEADGYKAGEISEAANLFKPDYVVITSIGDQHLMRLGSKNNLAKTLLEAVKCSKEDAKVVLTAKLYEEFVDRLGECYVNSVISNRTIIKVNDANSDNKEFVKAVALDLGVEKDVLEDSLNKLQASDRRGNLTNMHGFEVIDQSYNISYQTAMRSLKEVKEIADRKGKSLAVITAGIPELGEENKDANMLFGKALEGACEKIFLLKSILYGEVLEGVSDKDKVFIVNDFQNAVKEISAQLNPEKYMILFFPELDDLYY